MRFFPRSLFIKIHEIFYFTYEKHFLGLKYYEKVLLLLINASHLMSLCFNQILKLHKSYKLFFNFFAYKCQFYAIIKWNTTNKANPITRARFDGESPSMKLMLRFHPQKQPTTVISATFKLFWSLHKIFLKN